MAWKDFSRRKQYDTERYGDGIAHNHKRNLQVTARKGNIPKPSCIAKYNYTEEEIVAAFNKYLEIATPSPELELQKAKLETRLASMRELVVLQNS